jgi:hypothetical protein
VAIDACTTYSIGFRAPAATHLGVAFLDFLRDELDLPGRYADADLAAVHSPAAITAAMHGGYRRMLDGVRWDRNAIARFVGCWLSEPKPHVFFERPDPPLPPSAFRRSAAKHGVRLDLKSQLLYDDRRLYINGTALPWPKRAARHCAGWQMTGPSPPRPPPRFRVKLRRSSTIGTAMVTSTPASPDGSAANPSAPRYERLSSIEEQIAAIDTLIDLAKLSIRVFDVDLSRMGWNGSTRHDRLTKFLRATPVHASRSSCTTRAGSRARVPVLSISSACTATQ